MTTYKLKCLLMGAIWMGLSSFSDAMTWCGGSDIQDVICYSDGSCYVTANGYGGSRYYRISPSDPNKSSMVAIALSIFTAKTKARFAFVPDGLSCSNVPQETQVYGIGATTLF